MLYEDAIYQYRSEWLENLSLDIYIPSRRIGIEYQGLQHYQEVDVFGGRDSLEERQRRDKTKEALCAENNVLLLKWDYGTKINIYELLSFINTNIQEKEDPLTYISNCLVRNLPYRVGDLIEQLPKERRHSSKKRRHHRSKPKRPYTKYDNILILEVM